MYRYTGDSRDGTSDVNNDTGTDGGSDRARSYKNHYVPVVQSDKVRPAGVERQSRTTGVNNSPSSASVAYPPAAVCNHQPPQPLGQRRSELATAVFIPSPVQRLSVGHVSHFTQSLYLSD